MYVCVYVCTSINAVAIFVSSQFTFLDFQNLAECFRSKREEENLDSHLRTTKYIASCLTAN